MKGSPKNSFHKTLWLNAYERKKMKDRALYKDPFMPFVPTKRQACTEYHAHLRRGASILVP